jgi:hypothetical protein
MAVSPALNLILVLCDHDALFTAIELALTLLPGLQVMRLAGGSTYANTLSSTTAPGTLAGPLDLVIVAAAAMTSDPFTMLSDAGLLSQVGETPILILPDRPTRAKADNRITYLNFPFDMDQLTATVQAILTQPTRRLSSREQSHGR